MEEHTDARPLCGLCKKPDTQHHWIRECQHPASLLVCKTAEAKIPDIQELRNLTVKYDKKDQDLLHLAETLHDYMTFLSLLQFMVSIYDLVSYTPI